MSETWALFNRIYIDNGWRRFLPNSAIAILPFLASQESASSMDLDEELRHSIHSAEGLESDVWEPVLEFTDEELRRLDEDFEGTPFGAKDSEIRTAEEANAEALATRKREIAELADFSAHLGVPAVQTLADLLDFMTAAGVTLLSDGEYSINPDARLPEEVLPLSDSRREAEAQLRWGQIHQKLAQQIIALFKPDGAYSVNSLSSTIGGLAESLEADPQSIREALVVLVNEGDFSVGSDPLRAPADELLMVEVDWEAFHSSRLSIRFGNPEGADDAP